MCACSAATARPPDAGLRSPRAARPARGRRRRRLEDLPPAARARAHAQGARAAPAAAHGPRGVPGPARRLLQRRQRRVLRHRGAQRQRQVDAAQVPGRHLRHRPRAHLRQRAHVHVHRAGGRLQQRPARARQRDDQRDDAGPVAARGAPPLRRGDRLRRAARVRGPQAEELLVGHGGAPGLQRDDAGRRRGAADRRGAGRRRRLLPAEVLRRVRAHPPRGAHGAAGHPRHGQRAALLRPGDAAGARPGGRAGRARRACRRATWS